MADQKKPRKPKSSATRNNLRAASAETTEQKQTPKPGTKKWHEAQLVGALNKVYDGLEAAGFSDPKERPRLAAMDLFHLVDHACNTDFALRVTLPAFRTTPTYEEMIGIAHAARNFDPKSRRRFSAIGEPERPESDKINTEDSGTPAP